MIPLQNHHVICFLSAVLVGGLQGCQFDARVAHFRSQRRHVVLYPDEQLESLREEYTMKSLAWKKICSKKIFSSTHRRSVTGSSHPGVEHVAGYAEHRGESRYPAEYVCPPGILVAQVLDRCPLHQVEDEHSLEKFTPCIFLPQFVYRDL